MSQFKNALYILTEFAEGGDLRAYLKNNEPPWDLRVRMAIQMAQAISYLHSRSIVHRDIKTGIFVSSLSSSLPHTTHTHTHSRFSPSRLLSTQRMF